MERNVYLDHAATTYVKKEVLDEMMPFFTQNFGNPSSVYKLGQENKKAVELAKDLVDKGASVNEAAKTIASETGIKKSLIYKELL